MGEGHRRDTKTPPGRDGNDRGCCRKRAVLLNALQKGLSHKGLSGLTSNISAAYIKPLKALIQRIDLIKDTYSCCLSLVKSII